MTTLCERYTRVRRKPLAIVRHHLGVAQVDRQAVVQHAQRLLGRADAHAHHAFFGDAGHVRRDDHIVEAEIGMVGRQRLRRRRRRARRRRCGLREAPRSGRRRRPPAPRDTLTRIAPGLMRAMRSRLSRPVVSGVSGQQSTTMSLSATSSSTLAKRTSSGRLFGLRLLATTSRPKPCARDRHHRLADTARADHADRAAGKLVRRVGMVAAGEPALLAQVAVDHAKAPEQRHA